MFSKDFDWQSYALQSGISIVISIVALKILEYLINIILIKFSHGKRFDTLASVLKTSLKLVAFLVVLVIMVNPFIDLSKILAGAGVLGLVIGFGAQSIIKDMLTGFFLLFENQIHKGDSITINGKYTGNVEEIGFRAIKIREYSGKLLSISNGNIIEILNGNVDRRRVMEGLTLSVEENPREVIAELQKLSIYLTDEFSAELIRDEHDDIVEAFHVRGVDNLEKTTNGITYNIVGTVLDETYFTTMYAIREKLLQCAYDNGWRFSEQRMRIIEKDEPSERKELLNGAGIDYAAEKVKAAPVVLNRPNKKKGYKVVDEPLGE